jgi:hypothetical protein
LRIGIILFILAASLFIQLPSTQWSYHLDDLDNFYLISLEKSFSGMADYILSPGDGHFIPFIRTLYLVCFKTFWLDPFVFHSVMLFAFLLSGFLLIKLVERLSGSLIAGVFGGMLFLWSTSFMKCLETSFAHFVLSLPFVLGVLYAIVKYRETERRSWYFFASALAFLAPCVSAMGVLTGFWILLFTWLCLDKHKNSLLKRKLIALPLLSWFVGVVIFLIKVCPTLSAIKPGVYLQNAFVLTAKSLWIYILPSLGGFLGFAYFMLFSLIVIGIMYRKEIAWKPVCFFLLWMVGNYMFIYFSRGKWGMRLLNSQQYGLYAFAGFVAVCSLFFAPFIKYAFSTFLKRKVVQALLLVAAVGYILFQHNLVAQASQGRKSLLVLGRQTTDAIGEYCFQNNKKSISLKEAVVSYPALYPYSRPLSYFTAFLLFPDSKNKIFWSSYDEKSFDDYLNKEKEKYLEFYDLFYSAAR